MLSSVVGSEVSRNSLMVSMRTLTWWALPQLA